MLTISLFVLAAVLLIVALTYPGLVKRVRPEQRSTPRPIDGWPFVILAMATALLAYWTSLP